MRHICWATSRESPCQNVAQHKAYVGTKRQILQSKILVAVQHRGTACALARYTIRLPINFYDAELFVSPTRVLGTYSCTRTSLPFHVYRAMVRALKILTTGRAWPWAEHAACNCATSSSHTTSGSVRCGVRLSVFSAGNELSTAVSAAVS